MEFSRYSDTDNGSEISADTDSWSDIQLCLNFGYQYTFCNIADSQYQYIADIPIANKIIGATRILCY